MSQDRQKSAQAPFTAAPIPAGLGAELTTPGLQGPEMAEFVQNMTAVMERTQQIWALALNAQLKDDTPIHMDPLNAAPAFNELWGAIWANPNQLAEATLKYWTDQAEIWRRATLKAVGGESEPMAAPMRGDKRFQDPEWSANAVFDALKQSYLMTAAFLTDGAHNWGELEPRDRRKVDFYTRQFIEAISPTNFFMTNPQVLRATLEERGANLVRGLDNMLEDLSRGGGRYLMVRQTDAKAFNVGENLATTPGEVIYRNDVMELIQYAPTTKKVQSRPVVICPPWINKYYILDLTAEKSMVRWLVEQGHTVFMISWANPTPAMAHKEFADYISEGLFEAVEQACQECEADAAHVTAYCIGGTMTTTALAYLAQRPDHPMTGKIASATLLTTQTDFSDAGELQLFVDDEQISVMREQLHDGVFDAEKMALTFSMLRASDMLWNFVISNYMLGKEPFPFDLLYWNSDSTRMPGKLHMYYLEKFYRDDALAKGELRLGDATLNLGAITTPMYFLAAKEDHIAPAASVYRGAKQCGGPRRFVLAGSGHIAGVVNPPSRNKYAYWTREDGLQAEGLAAWADGAQETAGSWWGDWDGWLKGFDDAPQVSARKPARRSKSLAAAPGEYVRARYDQREE